MLPPRTCCGCLYRADSEIRTTGKLILEGFKARPLSSVLKANHLGMPWGNAKFCLAQFKSPLSVAGEISTFRECIRANDSQVPVLLKPL